ncbi:MAG: hypothetical protein MRERV_40c008 [Mycoplasmataceae bacterium RV_VA103A]|nr:MAG: hypothetical protein MRERV_40c008 [Mycoplasmataceae bacterium RV_VA103A]
MSYRELQLRQLIKNDYILKTTHQQEKDQLTAQFQQAKNNWEQEKKELQKARAQDLIDRLQKDLGINFLLDYSEVVKKLQGRTVEQLLSEEKQKDQEWEQEKTQATQHIQQLNKQIEGLTLLANKRKEDLEREKQALVGLAKQKIANKKEASELLKQLEEKWKREKEDWSQEKQGLEQKIKTSTGNLNSWIERTKKQDQIIEIREKEAKLLESKISQLKTTQDNLQTQNKELAASIHQISQDNQKLSQELQEKNNWKDDNLPQLKQELFSQAQELFIQLKDQISQATIAWGRQEIEKKQGELEEFFSNPERERERERRKWRR